VLRILTFERVRAAKPLTLSPNALSDYGALVVVVVVVVAIFVAAALPIEAVAALSAGTTAVVVVSDVVVVLVSVFLVQADMPPQAMASAARTAMGFE
jgi:hypothetical protein